VREIDRLGLLDAQGPVLAARDADLTDAGAHPAAAADERLDAVQRIDAAHSFDEPLRERRRRRRRARPFVSTMPRVLARRARSDADAGKHGREHAAATRGAWSIRHPVLLD